MLSNNFPNYFYQDDGTRIFYNANFNKDSVNKDSPVIVFNYGLMCNMAHFAPQIRFFEEHGQQILLYDYRGHYNSTSKDGVVDCTFLNLTDDIKQLIDYLNIEHCIMIGHSMGVNITLEYAIRYPEKLDKMILISGTVFPPQDVMFDSNAVELITPFTKWLTSNYPSRFEYFWKTSFKNPLIRYFIKDGGFNKDRVDDEFVQLYMKKISELPKEIFLHLLDEMKSHNIINYLEKIKTQTLIIGGDKDKVIPNYLQKIMHDKIKKSELYIVKNGSHVPQIDFPDFTNQRMKTFIEKKNP